MVGGCFGLVRDGSVILFVLREQIPNFIEIEWLNFFGFFLQEAVVEGFLPTDAVLFVYFQTPLDEIFRFL